MAKVKSLQSSEESKVKVTAICEVKVQLYGIIPNKLPNKINMNNGKTMSKR